MDIEVQFGEFWNWKKIREPGEKNLLKEEQLNQQQSRPTCDAKKPTFSPLRSTRSCRRKPATFA